MVTRTRQRPSSGRPAPAPTPPRFRFRIEPAARGKSVVITEVPADAPDDFREVYRDRIALDSADDRRKYAREAAPKIPGATDGIAARMEDQLLGLATEVAARAAEAAARAAEDTAPEGPPTVEEVGRQKLNETSSDVREAAEQLLEDPNLLERVYEDITRLGVAGERTLALTMYLLVTSRMLPHPLAAIIQGLSSSGKSFVIDRVGGMAPDEAVIRATALTPQALYYMPPGALSHRCVLAGERSRVEDDERAEATKALREMLSGGKLTKLTVVKEEGQLVSKLIEQEGPIAYVESTTLTSVFEEDANRCLMIQTDEQPAQTAAVIHASAARFAGRSGVGDTDRVRAVHHALQRMIPLADVVIPFADRVADLFNHDRVESRRAFSHLMRLVQAVTLLHHRQRDRDPDGRLVATPTDYGAAAELAAAALGRAAGELSPTVRRFWGRLRPRVGAGQWNTNLAMEGETVDNKTVYKWLGELASHNLIVQVSPNKGRVPAVWTVRRVNAAGNAGGDAGQTPTSVVPLPEEVFGG